MAQVDLINEEAAAELMMSGGQSGGGGGGSDKLLEYILQNATLVATCQHTTDYSVRVYYGTISYQDPNLYLFMKNLDYYDEFNFCCYKIGFLSENYYAQDYGPVVLDRRLDIAGFIPYVARILFKKESALFGDLAVKDTLGFSSSYLPCKVYYPDYIDENGIKIRRVKEIVLTPQIIMIPEKASYIDDYKMQPTLKFKTNAHRVQTIEGYIHYVYDSKGNKLNSNINILIPYKTKHYTLVWDELEDGSLDMTKRPTVIKDEKEYVETEYSFDVAIGYLPNPALMGNLNIENLKDIYFEYENQCWSEATPSGYTPYAVKSEILPYPEE